MTIILNLLAVLGLALLLAGTYLQWGLPPALLLAGTVLLGGSVRAHLVRQRHRQGGRHA